MKLYTNAKFPLLLGKPIIKTGELKLHDEFMILTNSEIQNYQVKAEVVKIDNWCFTGVKIIDVIFKEEMFRWHSSWDPNRSYLISRVTEKNTCDWNREVILLKRNQEETFTK